MTPGHLQFDQTADGLLTDLVECFPPAAQARKMKKSKIMNTESHTIPVSMYVAGTVEKRNSYRLLVGKPKGMRSLGRPKHRSVDNMKMDL
jgi:hypothetical protein